MVSSINSVRIWTQQTALKAFNEASNDSGNDASRSSVASLADMLSVGGGGDDAEDTALSSLIASLQQQAMTGGAAVPGVDDGSIEDISSDAFMKALQQKIEVLAGNPDTAEMAKAMQAALKAGTLTVSDVEAGTQIAGRVVAETNDASGDGKAASTASTTGIATIPTSDWSTFLKEHLKRDPYGKYLRNADSSHIDKASGASSYFGMIGETNYYLSWTTPKPDVTIQA